MEFANSMRHEFLKLVSRAWMERAASAKVVINMRDEPNNRFVENFIDALDQAQRNVYWDPNGDPNPRDSAEIMAPYTLLEEGEHLKFWIHVKWAAREFRELAGNPTIHT